MSGNINKKSLVLKIYLEDSEDQTCNSPACTHHNLSRESNRHSLAYNNYSDNCPYCTPPRNNYHPRCCSCGNHISSSNQHNSLDSHVHFGANEKDNMQVGCRPNVVNNCVNGHQNAYNGANTAKGAEEKGFCQLCQPNALTTSDNNSESNKVCPICLQSVQKNNFSSFPPVTKPTTQEFNHLTSCPSCTNAYTNIQQSTRNIVDSASISIPNTSPVASLVRYESDLQNTVHTSPKINKNQIGNNLGIKSSAHSYPSVVPDNKTLSVAVPSVSETTTEQTKINSAHLNSSVSPNIGVSNISGVTAEQTKITTSKPTSLGTNKGGVINTKKVSVLKHLLTELKRSRLLRMQQSLLSESLSHKLEPVPDLVDKVEKSTKETLNTPSNKILSVVPIKTKSIAGSNSFGRKTSGITLTSHALVKLKTQPAVKIKSTDEALLKQLLSEAKTAHNVALAERKNHFTHLPKSAKKNRAKITESHLDPKAVDNNHNSGNQSKKVNQKNKPIKGTTNPADKPNFGKKTAPAKTPQKNKSKE